MSRTKSLSDAIIAKLKARCPNIYYEDGVQVGVGNKNYPFITFELMEIGTKDGATKYLLEMDIVDYGKIKSTAEKLADDVQDDFHFYYHIDSEIQFRSYKEDRKSIKEEDKLVIRKRVVFELDLYDLRGGQ